MGAYYDEIEIEDMAWDEEKKVYHYPCPCGDRFEISRLQLANYEDIATCPSCSLIIRVIYDPVRPYNMLIEIATDCCLQLDFEDETDDNGDQENDEEEEEGSEGNSDDDHFEDALEKLTVSDEAPRVVAVTA